jgi:ABC-type bacteriocin/lantibiotic exporter with double-glycine peptidase domain
MGTDETGTSVAALARVAGRYGFRPRGVVVSWAGLQRQRLPLIALVRPDHYVIVERIDSRFVHFWDSSGAGSRKGQRQSVPHAAWRQLHTGVAVVLR